jgi:hypothetical protein
MLCASVVGAAAFGAFWYYRYKARYNGEYQSGLIITDDDKEEL